MDNINPQQEESPSTLETINEMMEDASVIEKNDEFSFFADEEIAKDIKSLVSEENISVEQILVEEQESTVEKTVAVAEESNLTNKFMMPSAQKIKTISSAAFNKQTLSRMTQYENKRKQKSAQLKITTDSEQVRDATFTPKISDKSKAMANGNKPIHERIEELIENSKQNMDSLLEAKQKKIEDEAYIPTFKPEIKDTGKKRSQEEFEKYMNDWQEAKKSTLKEKRETKEASLIASNSFKPTLNKKSLKIAVASKNRLLYNRPDNYAPKTDRAQIDKLMQTAPQMMPKVQKSRTPKNKQSKPRIFNQVSAVKKTPPKNITPLRAPRLKNKTPTRRIAEETLEFSEGENMETNDRVDSLPLDELVKQALEISLIEPEREKPPQRQSITPNPRQPASISITSPRNRAPTTPKTRKPTTPRLQPSKIPKLKQPTTPRSNQPTTPRRKEPTTPKTKSPTTPTSPRANFSSDGKTSLGFIQAMFPSK